MVRIEDRASGWLGQLKFETEDKTEFVISPTIGQKIRLKLVHDNKMRREDVTEDDLNKENEELKAMLKMAYPSFDDAKIDQILVKYGDEILLELYFAWKWRNREALEALVAKQKREIKQMNEDGKDESRDKKGNPE